MSVKIRFMRTGRTNRPYFRLAVSDTRFKKDGKCVEVLGVYDPLIVDHAKAFRVSEDRVKYWISQGAKPSPTAWTFLKKLGIRPKVEERRDRSGRKKPRIARFKKEAAARKAEAKAKK